MDFKQRMINLFKQLPDAKVGSGGREILMRCRYCGDSKRNLSDRHMYVKLPDYNTPMFYNCYRANCDAKGIVTYDKLIDWGINLSNEDISEIIKYNKTICGTTKIESKDKVNILTNNYIGSNTKYYDIKVKYINHRLGTNFTHEQLKKLKISLDLMDTINENNLSYNMNPNKLKQVSDNSIVFITQDNLFGICRNIFYKKDNSNGFRYFKYKIFENNKQNNSFYIIPTTVDISKKVKIFLAEGTFDILSIFCNIENDYSNSIYCAVLGAGYENAIKYFITILKIIDIEFHLYLDNDMNINVLRRILTKLEPYGYHVYIHNNMYGDEKDFGVPKNRIIDRSKCILKGW